MQVLIDQLSMALSNEGKVEKGIESSPELPEDDL